MSGDLSQFCRVSKWTSGAFCRKQSAFPESVRGVGSILTAAILAFLCGCEPGQPSATSYVADDHEELLAFNEIDGQETQAGDEVVGDAGAERSPGPVHKVTDYDDSWDDAVNVYDDADSLTKRILIGNTTPAGYYGNALAWDPEGKKMVLVGGRVLGDMDYSFNSDVWTLSSIGSGYQWLNKSPSGTLPGGRFLHGGAWDPVGHQFIVYGGANNNLSSYSEYTDTWSLTFPGGVATWTQLSPSGGPPTQRFMYSAVWDTVNNRMLIFAGGKRLTSNSWAYTNEVWALKFSGTAWAWSKLSPTGVPPSVRREPALAWDSANGRVIVFGGLGWNGSAYVNLGDAYVFDANSTNGAWTKLAPTGTAPAGRRGMSGTWDPIRSRMLIHGGYTTADTNETWALSFASNPPAWVLLSSSGATPPDDEGIHAVWDDANQKMLVVDATDSYSLTTYQVAFPTDNTAYWSIVSSYVCENDPLAADVSFPQSGGTMASCSPRLTWSGGNSYYKYDVWLNGEWLATDQTSKTYWLSESQMLPQGNQWMIRSKGCPGLYVDSATWTFDREPAQPFDGKVLQGPYACSRHLSWQIPGSSEGYYFDVYLNESLVATGLSTTEFVIPDTVDLLPSGNQWYVVAENCPGAQTLSELFSFDAVPPAPTALTPDMVNVSACGPTLSWNAVPDGDGVTYDVVLNGEMIAERVSETYVTLPYMKTLRPAGNTWSVTARACDGAEGGTASASFDMAESAFPPAPVPLSPAEGVTVDACSRTLSWDPNGDVDQEFDLFVGGSLVYSGSESTSFTLPGTVPLDPDYVWNVSARTCLTSESATQTFHVSPLTPTLVSPVQGATTTCSPVFEVGNYTGDPGDSYQIRVYRVSDPATPVLVMPMALNVVSPDAANRLTSGDYRWQATVTRNGCTLTSALQDFTVALNPAAAFQIVEPASGSQVPFESDLTWTSGDSAGVCLNRYEVTFGQFSVSVPADQNSLTLGLMDVTSTKYSDGFESGSWGSWCYSGFEAHTGDRSMYCGGTGNAATSFSPEIDLTTAKSATLEFWDYADIYGNLCSSASYMMVMSGTTVLGTIYYWYGIHFSWTHNVVDLTPYVGKKIKLVIVRPSSLNGCQVEWIIDDLKVTAVTETEPLQCGQNTLNVRAVNIDGTAFSASNGPMVVTYPPDPVTPVLVAPDDGIQTNCDTGGLTFQWTSAGHGSVYDFVLDGVVIASGLAGTSYVLPPGVYFKPSSTWGVVARNCRGVSAASETRAISATSSVTPTQPMLTAPDHGATVFCNQTFTWTGSAGLVYDVLINNVAVASGLTQTQYTPTGSAELADGTYGWKVRARNCAGTFLTSLPRSVIVSNAPPAPLLELPAEGGFVGASPAFDWSANGAPAWMTNKLIIDDEIVINVGGETSYAMLGTLSEGVHRWRVLVQGCTGFETYSAYGTFIVDTAPPSGPSPQSPANGAWTNQNMVTLSWNAASDGASGVSSYTVTAGTENLYPGNALQANWVLADQTPYNVTYNFDTSAQMADWSLSGSWGRTSSYHHSGSYGIADSPSGNFGNSWDYKAVLNRWFVAGENTSVSYWYLVEMLPWYTSYANDHVGLAVRTRTGNWVNLTDYYGMATGFGNDWFSPESVSLAAYENQEIQIALYIKTDSSNTAPGILIDDLVISNVLQNNKFVLDGVYDWFVSASDLVGNSATGEHFTLGVDRINPTAATLIAPASAKIMGPEPVSFSWNQATDALSGVDGYEVWMDGAVLVSTSGVAATTVQVAGISEGSHQWFVRSRDLAGNIADSITRNFKIDKTGPETPPTLVSPANASLLGSYITEMCFNAAVDSVSGINRYELYLDGQMYGQVESGQFCATAETPDGTHTWFIRAYDGVGNHTDSTEWSFVIDTTPPAAFTLVSPLSGSDTQNLSPTFCWHQTTDFGSGLDRYELLMTQTGGNHSVMSIQASTSQSDPICLTMPWTFAVGTYDWLVVAYDLVGNQTSAGGGVPWSLTVSADFTKPVPVVTTPAVDMTLSSGTFMNFQGSASDPLGTSGFPGSGVKYVRVQLDGVSGTWTNANLSGSISDAVRYWSWTWMAPTTGTHTLYVTAEDAEGNVSEPVARTFRFDNSGPDTFGLVEPANNAFSQGCPTFSWEPTQDSPGGLSHYVLTIFGSGSFVREYNVGLETSRTLSGVDCLPEQSYSWKVTAFDVFGYSTRSGTTNVLNVDSTGPRGLTLTGQTPIESTGWTCNDRSVSVTWSTATDGGVPAVGLATTPYQVFVDGVVDGEPTAATSMSLNGLADGQHTWTVRASDKLGNESYATANPGVGSFGIDCIPPAAPSLDSPVSGAILSRIPVEFVWNPVPEAVTDTSSGICSYILTFDDSSQATVGLETSVDWNASIEDGELPWKVAAVDCAGNVGAYSEQWFLTFDSTPPNDLVLQQPTDGEWLSTSSPELVWSTAHDQLTGVCSYTVSLDGLVEVVDALASTWTPSTPLAEGLHNWAVSAVDCAGNATVPASAVFGVDTVAPIPAVPSMPGAGTCIGSVLPTFLWDACKDDTSGIDVVKVVVDGVVVADGLDAAATVATPSAAIADGAHEWSVLCSDLAGNESGSAGSGFVVDTGDPTVAISGIYSQTDGSHQFTIEGTAADVGGCGVSNLLVRVGGGAWQTVGSYDAETGLWQTTLSLYDGDLSISVRATDMAGNVAYGTACSVSIGRCWVSGLCDPDTHICSSPAGQDVTCSTSSQCDTEEHCDGEGQCIGTPIVCDDGNPCTDDTCDTARGCVATGNHAACNDGDSCSLNDTCDGSGNCIGVAYSCGEIGECEVARECDGNGDCVVEYEGDGTGCSDDNLGCTDDACQQGVCVHSIVPGTCLISGQCFEDGQPEPGQDCTACNSGISGTAWTPRASTFVCDDENVCTEGDHCDGNGGCTGNSITCNEPGICEDQGYCDAIWGCIVVFSPEGSFCLDDNPCTVVSACDGEGRCVGEPYACVSTTCMTASCDGTGGCATSPVDAGQACDDMDECTLDDQCDGEGACLGVPSGECQTEDVTEDAVADVIEDTTVGDEGGPDDILVPDDEGRELSMPDVNAVDREEADPGDFDVPLDGVEAKDNGNPDDAASGHDALVGDQSQPIRDVLVADSIDGDTEPAGDGGGGCSSGNSGTPPAPYLLILLGFFLLALYRRQRT